MRRNARIGEPHKPDLKLEGDITAHWPLLNDTTIRIIRALHRSRNFMWTHDSAIIEAAGLTWGQFQTLIALRIEPPPHELTPTALYDAVQVTSGGLTKILAGLETAGHVARVACHADRRSRRVRLTASGLAMIERLVGELARQNGELLDEVFTAEEKGEFERLFGKLTAALERRDGGCSSGC